MIQFKLKIYLNCSICTIAYHYVIHNWIANLRARRKVSLISLTFEFYKLFLNSKLFKNKQFLEKNRYSGVKI